MEPMTLSGRSPLPTAPAAMSQPLRPEPLRPPRASLTLPPLPYHPAPRKLSPCLTSLSLSGPWVLSCLLILTPPAADPSGRHSSGRLSGSSRKQSPQPPPLFRRSSDVKGERLHLRGPKVSSPVSPTPQLALNLPKEPTAASVGFQGVPSLDREQGCLSWGSATAEGVLRDNRLRVSIWEWGQGHATQ